MSPRLSHDPTTIFEGRVAPSGVYILIHSKDEDLDPMSNTHALKPQPSILLRPRCPPSLMRKTFFYPCYCFFAKGCVVYLYHQSPASHLCSAIHLQLLPDSIMIIASRRFCRDSAYKPRFFWPAR